MPGVVLIPRGPGPINALGFTVLRPRIRAPSCRARESENGESADERRPKRRRRMSKPRKDSGTDRVRQRLRSSNREASEERPHMRPRSCSRSVATAGTEEDSHQEAHRPLRRRRKVPKKRRGALRQSALRPRLHVSARVRGLQEDYDSELLSKCMLTRQTKDRPNSHKPQEPDPSPEGARAEEPRLVEQVAEPEGDLKQPISVVPQSGVLQEADRSSHGPLMAECFESAALPTSVHVLEAADTAVGAVTSTKLTHEEELLQADAQKVSAGSRRFRRPRWWRPQRAVVPAAILQLQELCTEMKAERRALCKATRAGKDGRGAAAELRQLLQKCGHDLETRFDSLATRFSANCQERKVLTMQHQELQLAYAKLLAGPQWKPRRGALRPPSTLHSQSWGGGEDSNPESDDDVIVEEAPVEPGMDVSERIPKQVPSQTRSLSEEREQEERAEILARASGIVIW
ncbi:unnamed protein product [Symbiodinium sp. CCMP2456]|nr:unnamed protein product [Symbiodinium sp. CCMP2456]